VGLPILRDESAFGGSPLQLYVASGFIPDVCFILNVQEILKNKQGRSFERPYNVKHRQKVNPLTRVEGNLGLSVFRSANLSGSQKRG